MTYQEYIKQIEYFSAELKQEIKTVENFNYDMVRLNVCTEYLNKLINMNLEEDSWYQERLHYFIYTSAIAHFEIMLMIICRIVDKESRFSLEKVIEKLKEKGFDTFIKTKLDEFEVDLLSKHHEKYYLYYKMCQLNYSNFNISKKFNTLSSNYSQLKIKEIRDEYLSHNGKNMTFLNGINVGIYKNKLFEKFVLNINKYLYDLLQLLDNKEISRALTTRAIKIGDVLEIVDKKAKEDIEQTKNNLSI